MASNKKVSQKDLRQMMKERKQIQCKEVTKIESPLARYDSNGRLSCILCDIQINSDSLWSSHIVGKIHKNKLEEIKRKKLNPKPNEVKTTKTIVESKSEDMKPSLKRKIQPNNDNEMNNKLMKTSVSVENDSNNRNSYERINESFKSEATLSSTDSNSINSEVKELPNDFFDNPNELNAEKNTTKVPDIDLGSNSLPKGFFDDPILDAKARHVPFKDPIDEEWDKFQKVIAEETNTSQIIIEEDIEEIQVERNLEEIEEQISSWAKVEVMQKKAEELHSDSSKKPDLQNMESQSSDSSDIDDQEMNVFSNWRSRGALNSK